MPKFQAITSPQGRVLRNEKKLTLSMPFELETEKRSNSKFQTKLTKPTFFLQKDPIDLAYGSDKENAACKAPVKRPLESQLKGERISSKRKMWSPPRQNMA